MPIVTAIVSAVTTVGAAVTAAGSVGAAIAGGAGLAATAINTALAFGLSLGLSALSGALGGPKKENQQPGVVASTLQIGGNIPRQVVFGHAAVKGQLVFAATGGAAKERLCLVFVLSDGWVGGLRGVWFGDRKEDLTTLEPDGNAVAKYTIARFGDTGFGDNRATIWFYDGRPGQGAPARPREFAPDRFAATDRLAGMAHVVVELINNNDTFDGIPEFLWEIDGYRCYDPRRDSTAGGSGPHRAEDPATWETTGNPALHILAYMKGIQCEGQVLMGMGLQDFDILTEMFVSAANVCDEAVPLEAGGDEYRYRASHVITAEEADHRSALAPVLQSMAGYLVERGGAFGVIPGIAYVPSATLTDADIVWSRGVRWSGSRTRTERTNEVHGQFVDPATGWQANSYPPVLSSLYSDEDGERLAVQLDFSAVTSPTQAQRIARARMRETRRQASATITLGFHFLWVEPGDWLVWASALCQTTKTYRVVSRDLNPDDTVTLQLREVGNEIYSWSAEEAPILPLPGAPGGVPLPSTVENFQVQADVVVNSDGSTRPVVVCSWNPIEDDRIVAVIIEYRVVETLGATRVRDDSPADGVFVLDQPPTGRPYEFRATIRTVPARPTTWTTWVTIGEIDPAKFRIDYDDLKAGIRYRTQQLPQIEPVFGAMLEGMVDGFNAGRLAETGIRLTEQTKIDLTQALATTSTEIRAELSSGLATVFAQTAALATQDTAFAGQLTQFNARVGANEAALSTETATRVNQVSALSQQITSLTASFSSNAASTSASLQALSNALGSYAQQLDTVNARYNTLFAGGAVRFAAVAAPAGVFARYSVELEASAGGARYQTGLFMELIQQGGTFYSQVFIDTQRFVLGNPLTRSVPFAVIDGVTYIEEAVIRNGALSRHASADSGGRQATIGLAVRNGSRVNVVAVYSGGQSLVNGAPTTMGIYRNGGLIKNAVISSVSYAVNAGGSLTYYNNTTILASYDVSYDGVDTLEVLTQQASGVSTIDLNGVSIQAVCFNK